MMRKRFQEREDEREEKEKSNVFKHHPEFRSDIGIGQFFRFLHFYPVNIT